MPNWLRRSQVRSFDNIRRPYVAVANVVVAAVCIVTSIVICVNMVGMGTSYIYLILPFLIMIKNGVGEL